MASVNQIDEDILNGPSPNIYTYMDEINQQLKTITELDQEQLDQAEKPSGIIDRVFVDVFGVVGLYLMLFILSDFTRVVITGGPLFGIKWLVWGPYYYITKAPLLTRVWETKKFLKDLAEVEVDPDFEWQENVSCTEVGNTYLKNCNDQVLRNHPVRDKLGDGLDWLIRHTIGKSFGGILGSGDCEDQSTTISHACAVDKVNDLWDAYNGFCDIYPTLIVNRALDINWPNGGSNRNGMDYWNDYEKAAYNMYFDGYNAIFDTGSSVHTSNDYPTSLNTAYDSYTFYCYNAAKIWGMNGFGGTDGYSYLNLPVPAWYWSSGQGIWGSSDYKFNQMYFQQNYKAHAFDV